MKSFQKHYRSKVPRIWNFHHSPIPIAVMAGWTSIEPDERKKYSDKVSDGTVAGVTTSQDSSNYPHNHTKMFSVNCTHVTSSITSQSICRPFFYPKAWIVGAFYIQGAYTILWVKFDGYDFYELNWKILVYPRTCRKKTEPITRIP